MIYSSITDSTVELREMARIANDNQIIKRNEDIIKLFTKLHKYYSNYSSHIQRIADVLTWRTKTGMCS
jgi:hypothetical protein